MISSTTALNFGQTLHGWVAGLLEQQRRPVDDLTDPVHLLAQVDPNSARAVTVSQGAISRAISTGWPWLAYACHLSSIGLGRRHDQPVQAL
jgi:hypothetical protein